MDSPSDYAADERWQATWSEHRLAYVPFWHGREVPVTAMVRRTPRRRGKLRFAGQD